MKTQAVVNIGGHNVPRVIADFSGKEKITSASLFSVGYNYSVPLDKWNISEQACDYIYLGKNKIDFEIPGTLGLIYDAETWATLENKTRAYPLFKFEDFPHSKTKSNELNFIELDAGSEQFTIHDSQFTIHNVVLILSTNHSYGMAEQRRFFFELMQQNSQIPVIIKRNYPNETEENFQLYSSTDCGALFIDGFGDGIFLSANNKVSPTCINATSFGILQATRMRISKTEYISCPSCGRTLFDLQETTARIRSRTSHLKGLKIGIMGCIVNGPGEMADADYGYVGVGVGKITLYKGKEVVQRGIDTEKAVDALIDLIKENGDWVEEGK